MSEQFRGGNSRQLAKTLDLFDRPLAILDRKGQIVFVNSAMCQLANLDATVLVGKQTSWEISEDSPQAALLTALAPPASVRQGQVAVRRLTTPVVFGSSATGQLFVPLMDTDQVVHSTLVVLDRWEAIQSQVVQPSESANTLGQAERIVADVRSRWPQLDGLHGLLGESSAIRLAMTRAQLALTGDCHCLIHGPPQVGKSQVAKGVFTGRLHHAGLPQVSGQFFSIDCQLLDATLIDGMLEVFAGRLHPSLGKRAHLLVLDHLDALPDAGLPLVLNWLQTHVDASAVAGVSRVSPEALVGRGPMWRELVHRLAEIEIALPALHARREDVVPLAQHFLAGSCRRAERAMLSLAPDTQDQLVAYPWPQNLAQLRAAIEEAVNMAVLTSSIQVSHLPAEIRAFKSTAEQATLIEPIDLDQVLLDVERVMIRRAIKLSPRNRAQVARWLGISRPRLLRRISQLGLEEED